MFMLEHIMTDCNMLYVVIINIIIFSYIMDKFSHIQDKYSPVSLSVWACKSQCPSVCPYVYSSVCAISLKWDSRHNYYPNGILGRLARPKCADDDDDNNYDTKHYDNNKVLLKKCTHTCWFSMLQRWSLSTNTWPLNTYHLPFTIYR